MISSASTSILLVAPLKSNHQQQVLSFIEAQQLLNPKQLNTNILWFNQEAKGLKIKTIRSIIELSKYSSYQGNKQTIALLYADQSSIPAQNALLKILEEPPANTLIISTTSQPEKLLPTIRSRCLTVYYSQEKSVSPQDMPLFAPHIMQVAKQLLDPNFSYQEAVGLAAHYKDREEALELTNNLINYLYQQLQSLNPDTSLKNFSRQQHEFVLKQLLALYGDLGRNFNTQLAIEHHLFGLVTT